MMRAGSARAGWFMPWGGSWSVACGERSKPRHRLRLGACLQRTGARARTEPFGANGTIVTQLWKGEAVCEAQRRSKPCSDLVVGTLLYLVQISARSVHRTTRYAIARQHRSSLTSLGIHSQGRPTRMKAHEGRDRSNAPFLPENEFLAGRYTREGDSRPNHQIEAAAVRGLTG